MQKRDIIRKVKALGLPEGGYVVYGGCPLTMAGLRSSNDIDLLVSDAVIRSLPALGWQQITKSEKDRPYLKGNVEAHLDWGFSSYQPSLRHLLATAKYVDGIPFASLYEVKKWKQSSGRPNDIVDLKLIDAYLANRQRNCPIITLCSSANFYKQSIEVKEKLEAKGYQVLVPSTALKMHKSGDYVVSHYKTWFGNKADYYKKTARMRGHFNEVDKADATLVINYQKGAVDNYIGGNVLMEMALAFYLHKPIYILNGLPESSSYIEEIEGLNPVVLNGKLDGLEVAS